MPGDIHFQPDTSYFGQNPIDYVLNGTISESRVDDMVTRILAAWYFLGQDKYYPSSQTGCFMLTWLTGGSFIIVSFNYFDLHDEVNNKHVDVQENHYKIFREICAASAILLKNEGNILPLTQSWSIVVIGDDAGPALHGPKGFTDRGGDDGVLGMGWGGAPGLHISRT